MHTYFWGFDESHLHLNTSFLALHHTAPPQGMVYGSWFLKAWRAYTESWRKCISHCEQREYQLLYGDFRRRNRNFRSYRFTRLSTTETLCLVAWGGKEGRTSAVNHSLHKSKRPCSLLFFPSFILRGGCSQHDMEQKQHKVIRPAHWKQQATPFWRQNVIMVENRI